MSPSAPAIQIGARRIGAGHPLFVIAEIGLNHGGSVDRALAMVAAAADAGVSAVKLQTVVARDFIAPSPLRDFFAHFELDEAAHRAVAARARVRGLAFVSTPLSLGAVDMLERVGVDAYKIASADLTFTQLIEGCGATRKPVIVSTGMGTLEETEAAIAVAQRAGATGVAVLHCVSAYPVPRGSENLRAIATLASVLTVPVGLSDHGADTFAVPLAVALGASLYERHIVLDEGDGSVDAAVSSTPSGFAALIANAARAAGALGTGIKSSSPAEAASAASRRGLYAAHDLPAGHVVSERDVIALRPASDLPPDALSTLIGLRLPRAVAAGAPFLASDREECRGVA
jgi:sialic acid synthase SpsE